MQALKIAAATVLVMIVLFGAILVYTDIGNLASLPQPASVSTAKVSPTVYVIPLPSPLLPTVTEALPTVTKQTCEEELRDYVKNTIDPLVLEWTDTAILAMSSPRFSVVPQISKLQELRRKMQYIEETPCTEPLNSLIREAMEPTLDALMAFSGGEPDILISIYATDGTEKLEKVRIRLDEIRSSD